MDRKNLLEELEKLQVNEEPVVEHEKADELLLQYIGDAEVTEAFNKINRWYG